MAKFNPDVLPVAFRRDYDALPEAGRLAWQEQRLKGQTDLLFLGAEVLGMDFQPNPHGDLFSKFLPKDPNQEKQLYDLDEETKKRMILWPRGLFKTSAIVVEIVQLILNFPNIRILILSGSRDLTKRQLARVKKVFEKPTEKFKQLYPDFYGEKLGTSEEFTVPNRTINFFAEPTVAISSAKSVKAGSHFDVIFVDDLVNDQNYKSASALEKCWEDYKDIGPLLQPSGFLYVTGTRYSFGDTYEKIQEAANKEVKETGKTVWKFSIRTCWTKLCATCGHPDVRHDSDKHYTKPPCTMPDCKCECFVDSGKKEVLFPRFKTRDGRTEGHTVEFLESERREKGDEFFACQYENNPILSGTQTFTQEVLDAQTLYHLKHIPPAGSGATVIIGDLSYIGNDKRDKSVLYVCRIQAGQIFVFDCVTGKWDSDGVATNILATTLKYRPQRVYIERFLGWEAYDNVIRAKAVGLNIQHLPLEWMPMSQVEGAKKIRIGSVKSWLAQRRLWLFAGMPEFETLCTQLKRFPKLGKHDDFADCLGLVVQAPTGVNLVPAPDADQSGLGYVHGIFGVPGDDEDPEEVYPSNGCGSCIVC